MTYRAFIKNLNNRGMFRIRPGLANIRKVLRVLGNPQEKYPAIHIAGTNGKGSVAAALEAVLRANGYRTGLYTSPHLVDLRERIQMAGAPASRSFLRAANAVLHAEKKARTTLTYFELLTAIAFSAFAEQKVDIAVVECGLGGAWDATNVLKRPLLGIITSIGLDHTEWLGKTETQIARQKAGIIKRYSSVISGVRGPARKTVQNKAFQMKVKIHQIDTDFKAIPLTSSWRTGKQVFSFLYKGSKTEIVPFGLLGKHQVDNAGVVMMALKQLAENGYSIDPQKRDTALRNIHWPGRLQLVPSTGTPILLDAAHNPPALIELLHTLTSSTFKKMPKTFVFSAFKDKDFRSMARMITPFADEICLTPLPKPRGAALPLLRAAFRNVEGPVRVFPDISAALKGALRDTPKDGLVVVTGSLFLVGQALPALSSLRKASLHV